ncbi:Nrd1 complex RNA-binding subunit [Sporobolomyces koalae]|uniref:Nrd1 complex RNA-binding subunit n=1 Tax=Sporobolomyces koalae TaxID=500713 RepID=UPI0031815D21
MSLDVLDGQIKAVIAKNKLSSSLVEQIVSLALDNIQNDTALITLVYRHHKKAHPNHKLTSLYLVDAIARGAKSRLKKQQQAERTAAASTTPTDDPPPSTTEVGTDASFLKKLDGLLSKIVLDVWEHAPTEHREKVRKVLDIWTKAGTFNSSTLARLGNKLLASTAVVNPKPDQSPIAPAMSPQGGPLATPDLYPPPPATTTTATTITSGIPANVLALLQQQQSETQLENQAKLDQEREKRREEEMIERILAEAQGKTTLHAQPPIASSSSSTSYPATSSSSSSYPPVPNPQYPSSSSSSAIPGYPYGSTSSSTSTSRSYGYSSHDNSQQGGYSQTRDPRRASSSSTAVPTDRDPPPPTAMMQGSSGNNWQDDQRNDSLSERGMYGNGYSTNEYDRRGDLPHKRGYEDQSWQEDVYDGPSRKRTSKWDQPSREGGRDRGQDSDRQRYEDDEESRESFQRAPLPDARPPLPERDRSPSPDRNRPEPPSLAVDQPEPNQSTLAPPSSSSFDGQTPTTSTTAFNPSTFDASSPASWISFVNVLRQSHPFFMAQRVRGEQPTMQDVASLCVPSAVAMFGWGNSNPGAGGGISGGGFGPGDTGANM